MHRLLRFRAELIVLWRAFLAPGTPLYLKALMVLIPLYLISPLDLIPDVIPFAGWLDDAIVIPLLVSWIVGLLTRSADPGAGHRRDESGARVIDGTARRL
jgi:uncharacterized membrane protein YkvA (DUF1232 family)